MQGKIIEHGSGLGAPSPDDVRRRAHELALIDGRTEPGDEDWIRAKRELHGGHDFSDDGDSDAALFVSERDMVAGNTGRHLPNLKDDTEHAVEELIAEGMDEAEHDQMLSAARAARLEEDPLAEED